MKKILSLLLVGIMVVSMVPTAFATTDYSNGTQVSYNAEADNDGDGQPDHAEAYTVTVPALLAPGASGNVVAQGTWASNRKLTVTADDDVTLTNSINAADQKVLDVTFPGIELAGSNTAAVTDTKVVGVADIEAALFGTWSGVFEYQVEMVDAAELISFNIYNDLRWDYVTGEILTEWLHPYGEFQAEAGMTWEEWVDSDYNTLGLVITPEGRSGHSVYLSDDPEGYDTSALSTFKFIPGEATDQGYANLAVVVTDTITANENYYFVMFNSW